MKVRTMMIYSGEINFKILLRQFQQRYRCAYKGYHLMSPASIFSTLQLLSLNILFIFLFVRNPTKQSVNSNTKFIK